MNNCAKKTIILLLSLVFLIQPAVLVSGEKQKSLKVPAKGFVFVFQGDSITDGARQRNSFTDLNHVFGHGYVYMLAGRIGAEYPEAGFVFHNRGLSSNKVTDLSARWTKDALDLNPDLLSILVGTNDAGEATRNPDTAPDIATFEREYRSILTQSREKNPDLIIVIGIPFIYPVGKMIPIYETRKKETDQRIEIIRALAEEFGAIVVDYPAVFEKATKRAPIQYWVWDGVHPTAAGHELMAREWQKQVAAKLKFLK